MFRSFTITCAAICACSIARTAEPSAGVAAPRPEVVQGFYAAPGNGDAGQNIEARLVALKDGYQLLIRQISPAGSAKKATLAGKATGEVVAFAGTIDDQGWTATWSAGQVALIAGAAPVVNLPRQNRASPTMGAKPPEGAIVLIDGKQFDNIVRGSGKSDPWKIEDDGAISALPGGLASKQPIAGSFDAHIEFRNPFMPAATGQDRGNSGVFLPNGDEIQVLDSFGMTTYTGGCCGGLYRYKDPDAFEGFPLASAPPLQWQTYDIAYRVENDGGKPKGKPRVTVQHNGIRIHDNVELQMAAKPGVLKFQDHRDPVLYRNIWVVPVPAATAK
jgi:hypothetical protein